MRKDEFQIVEAYGKQMIKETLQELRAEIEANMWTNDKYRYEKNALASGLEKAVQIIDRKISEVQNESKRIDYKTT